LEARQQSRMQVEGGKGDIGEGLVAHAYWVAVLFRFPEWRAMARARRACVGGVREADCREAPGDCATRLIPAGERPSLTVSSRQTAGPPRRGMNRFHPGDPMNDTVIHATDADFDSAVLQSEEPVLVDFWAQWCGPCKMIAPALDQLAAEYAGKAKVVKVDIDQNRNTAMKYHVRSIPMLLLFKDGQVQATQIGAVGKAQLSQMIDKAL